MSKLYNKENLRRGRKGTLGVISYGFIEEHGINDDEWKWLTENLYERLYSAFSWHRQPKEVKDAVYSYVDLPLKSRKVELKGVLSKYRITTETPNYKEFDIEWI